MKQNSVRKNILIFLSLIFSIQISANQITDSKINYMTIEGTAEPFQIDRTDSNQKGLITDIVDLIFNKLYKGKTYNTVTAPFLRTMKVMKENHHRKWICYGAKEWGPPQNEYLSKEALFTVNHKLVTRKNFKFKSIRDLFGKRIVLINGFQYPGLDKYIKEKKIDVLIVNSHASALKAIQIKRADAFPEIKIRANYHIKRNKLKRKDFKFHKFSQYIKDYNFHLAFSKAMSPEIYKFDREIRRLRDQKMIKKLILKYLR